MYMSPYWLNEAEKASSVFGLLQQDVFQHWQDLVLEHGNHPGTPYGDANQRIIWLKEKQKWGSLNLLLCDDSSIENWAAYQASYFKRRWTVRGQVDPDDMKFAEYLGIEAREMLALINGSAFWQLVESHLKEFPLEPSDVVPSSDFENWIEEVRWRIRVLKRLCNPRWWLRRARAEKSRLIEEMKRLFGHVHASREIYLSSLSFEYWKKRQSANLKTLQETEIENDLGQRFTLAELFYKSNSNPAIRRIEMMTRIAGTEKLAKSLGYKATFITITAPSAFHPYSYRKSKKGRKFSFKNKRYEGFTVREAQQYLAGRWAVIRAELHRNEIDYFGIRVVEPHHDGCPHWHLLLFSDTAGLSSIEQVITEKSLNLYAGEPGAQKRRVKVERIKEGLNPKTGKEYSAVGYIAKYISKAIDGRGIEKDLFDNDAATSAQRIRAWASIHGIRQFQFLGGIKATWWRELRRFAGRFMSFDESGKLAFDERAAFMYARDCRPELMHLIAAIRDMEVEADASVAYCDLAIKIRSGELQLKTLTTAHGHEYADKRTGEITRFDQWARLNQYGELQPTVKGLWFLSGRSGCAESVITHEHEWHVLPGRKKHTDLEMWH
ncbi:hypothetical Protein YC6258_03781 [Gynuella sunshinyii YC6258]|uniref:Replication gene A protein-like domain-containing protein n=2 Tax=Gynuella sunshinyii TaxID=1445505 RepID=A0A0C5VM82_9GAMM|nr:hypothetical Protein YC6258_03781 [Gynuella sunshinyii YC6258]